MWFSINCWHRKPRIMKRIEFVILILCWTTMPPTVWGQSNLIVEGNIGVGNNNPQRNLHIRSNTITLPQLRLEDPQGYFELSGGEHFRIQDGNNTKFFIRGSGTTEGNIGIGTTSPQRKLQIRTAPSAPQLRLEDFNGYFDMYAGSDFHLSDETSTRLFIAGSGAAEGNIGIGTTLPERKLHLIANPSAPQIRIADIQGYVDLWGGADFSVRTTGDFVIRNDFNTNFKVASGGELFARFINNIGDHANMQFNQGTGEIGYDNSSRRYKINIETLEDQWSKLLNARPVRYARPNSPDYIEYGYIAEEIDSIGLTNMVGYDMDGLPNDVRYDKMVIYLVEILKMQEARINEMEKSIRNLGRSIKN